MKEAILELRSSIRRLRPNLLLRQDHEHHHHPPSTQQQQQFCESTFLPKNDATVGEEYVKPSSHNTKERDGDNQPKVVETNESSIINELQLEAASELVDAIASFVWSLDNLWDSCLTGIGRENPARDDDGDGLPILTDHGEKIIIRNNNNDNNKATNKGRPLRNNITREPHTEWNEEAKSLICEGYDLIATSTRSSSLLSNEEDGDNYQQMMDNSQLNYQQEATRAVVRTSILDLLPLLSTGACRNFLLVFLPHFLPLALLYDKREEDGSVPLWLKKKNDEEEDKGYHSSSLSKTLQRQFQRSNMQTAELVDNAMVHIVDAFQSLIQTDTLVPFLATISIIFENFPDDGNDPIGSDSARIPRSSDAEGFVPSVATVDPGSVSNNAREKCFHLCLSSLPSISEDDLPSLLHSLFTLVRSDEEGQLAMEGVRAEWMSVCGSDSMENTNSDTISNGNNLVLLIGEVLIESILSGQLPGSKHLAKGFIDTLRISLRTQHERAIPGHSNSLKETEECQSLLTSLDVIVMVALYSNPDYQRSVESIVDSMVLHQNFSFIKLMHPLIRSWVPSDTCRKSERERTNSLLYEPLASPMISILFYIMMSSSSLVAQSGSLEYALRGGLLPFHAESISYVKDAAGADTSDSYMIADVCCRVFSQLFSAVDPQRQDLIINSLLSMVSDSFVRSTPSDSPRKRNRKRQRHQGSNATTTVLRKSQNHEFILLAAARAACRTLLIITNKHASDISQIRGAVLDRLLLLASTVVATTSSSQSNKDGDDLIAFHLFDMNCAIIISLLNDTNQEGETTNHSAIMADGGGSSELLILCQKLLFSANYMSTTTAIASGSYQHRAICGLILASRLLRCKLIPNGERGGVLSWVVSVVSPSSSSATPLEALNPEIARWGLSFLQFASSILPANNTPRVTMVDNCVSGFPEMTHFVDTQFVCGQSDIFAQVKKMLATAAIVQMEDSLRVPLLHATKNDESFATTSPTFLAFAEVSPHDHLRQKKSPATASMVVCAPYFLYGTSTQKECGRTSIMANVNTNKPFLESIHLVADYVYDLVDQYLELGLTTTTSWNPRGWLLAKIQLPCCLTGSAMEILGMKKNYGLEVDGDLEDHTYNSSASLTFDLDANDERFQKSWKLLFSDETKSKSTLLQNLVEFVNCVIISISVSCATLKHAYHHFQREEAQLATMGINGANVLPLSTPVKSDEPTRLHRRKRKQLEALRKLLQFQVNKIHTMQRISKNIFFALKGLYSEVCKLNTARNNRRLASKYPKKEVVSKGSAMEYVAIDASEDKAAYERKQIPLSEVKAVVVAIEIFLSSQINTVDNSLLWSCLDDDADDRILLEHYADTTIHSPVARAVRILRLRRHILLYLHRNITQLNNDKTGSTWWHPETNKLQHSDALSLRGISRVFRMAISLTPCLNVIGKRGKCHARQKSSFAADLGCPVIGAFLSAHYQLLLAVFSFAIKTVPIRSSMKDSIALAVTRKLPPEPKDRDYGYFLFSSTIQRCADSISSTPTDTGNSSAPEKSILSLSSLSAPAQALSESLIQQLNCEDATISCHIIDLLSILFIHTECPRGNDITFADTLHSIYTSSVGKANLPYTIFKISDILSRATKNEEHESDRTSIVKENFTSLIRTANALLKAKDSFTVAFIHHILAHWGALVFEGATQFYCLNKMVEAVDTLLDTASWRPKGNSSPLKHKHNTLPGLNEKNCGSLFELLLHLTNTSLSLSKPQRVKKKRSSKAYQVEGPYGEMLWPLEIYGKLLSIFQSNHHFFPRRLVFIVIKNCLLLVRLSDYQVRQCVQWRNSQHSQIGTGKDLSSVEYLQPLVDGVASHCVGGILSFCNTLKGQLNTDKRSWGSSCKQTKAIAGLLYRCKGTKKTLLSICQSQNLTFPKDFTSLLSSSPKRKRDDDHVQKKRQRIERELSLARMIRSRGSSNKVFTSPSVLEQIPASGHSNDLRYDSINMNSKHQSDSENSRLSGDSDDDSMLESDDDNSFGVIGDWAT